MKLFFILEITAEDETGATSPRRFCLPPSTSQSHTGKMNMQHFLFVLLKRPLNASREKPDINTCSPPCLREGRAAFLLERALIPAGKGCQPCPAQEKRAQFDFVSADLAKDPLCVGAPFPTRSCWKGFSFMSRALLSCCKTRGVVGVSPDRAQAALGGAAKLCLQGRSLHWPSCQRGGMG